uniref:Uncharacterized protein n=1 Tax=Tetraselmis sp. GSL018 TaxID=582737 RepID=A0A061SJP6_9CHLO
MIFKQLGNFEFGYFCLLEYCFVTVPHNATDSSLPVSLEVLDSHTWPFPVRRVAWASPGHICRPRHGVQDRSSSVLFRICCVLFKAAIATSSLAPCLLSKLYLSHSAGYSFPRLCLSTPASPLVVLWDSPHRTDCRLLVCEIWHTDRC